MLVRSAGGSGSRCDRGEAVDAPAKTRVREGGEREASQAVFAAVVESGTLLW